MGDPFGMGLMRLGTGCRRPRYSNRSAALWAACITRWSGTLCSRARRPRARHCDLNNKIVRRAATGSVNSIPKGSLMKYLIASDIHGSAYWTERLVAAIESEQPDRIVLLGDLLYHGPRNDLPRDYAPKRVIPLLNALADRIIAVRGNCDAEVDQMVLDFPVMADYATLFDETGRELFLTHGHVFGAGMHNSVDHAPALPEGSALVYGHTHIKVNEASAAHPGLWLFNPGSVSIPKDGTHSYGIYEGGAFRHVVLEEE